MCCECALKFELHNKKAPDFALCDASLVLVLCFTPFFQNFQFLLFLSRASGLSLSLRRRKAYAKDKPEARKDKNKKIETFEP